MPIEKEVSASTKPQMPTAVPADIKAMTFSTSGLPKSDTGTIQKVTSGTGDGIVQASGEVKKDEVVHQVVAPVEEVVAKKKTIEQVEAEVAKHPEAQVKTEKKEEKKSEPADPIEKWLKPPGSKKEVKIEGKEGEAGVEKVVAEKGLKEPNTTGHFDYSKYNAVESNYLKNMSREAREFTSKLMDESKELRRTSSSMYFQDPKAYVLDPGYQQLEARSNQIDRETKHNYAALMAIQEGKSFKYLTGVNDKGEFTYSQEMQPSAQAAEMMRTAYQTCIQAKQGVDNQKNQYPDQFKGVVNETLATINHERSKRFPWAGNAKYLDYEIATAEGKDLSVKQIKQDFSGMFPSFLRNSPLMEVASDLMTALMMRDQEIRELQKVKTVVETKNEELKRGEPSSITKPALDNTKAVNGVKTFSLAGMPKN